MRTVLSSVICSCLVIFLVTDVSEGVWNVFDIRYWRCVMKRSNKCPDPDIRFFLYTHETGTKRQFIDVRNSFALKASGFDPLRKNVIIIHGFNGTESKTPMTILRNAYLSRTDYNVFTVDWEPLTKFPCYISALNNMRLVSQCTAQLYAYIMDLGGNAKITTCIGHSLGAHICGMISNHLTIKQHRIVGLDPAKPLVTKYGSPEFRLTKDDAYQVQVIHTNAGFLGEVDRVGHVDFCLNGGRMQPGCKGHRLRIARCSHFQSACYFAASVRNGSLIQGYPCSHQCPKPAGKAWGFFKGNSIPMGEDTPFKSRGSFCVKTYQKTDCPFN